MTKKRGRRSPVTCYGKWVYTQLLEQDMTLEELSQRIGVAAQNLSSYFHGHKQGFGYRAKVEAVLGEPPTEIKYSPDVLAG